MQLRLLNPLKYLPLDGEGYAYLATLCCVPPDSMDNVFSAATQKNIIYLNLMSRFFFLVPISLVDLHYRGSVGN